MSLKEQAKTVLEKIGLVQDKIYMIQHLCEMVMLETQVNGDIIELTAEDKQKLIQHYQTKKAELKALVEELP